MPVLDSPNPFSTRFTRPGVIAYIFSSAVSAEELLDRLRRLGWWGQIVGTHGSGKSTLIHTLMPLLQTAGRSISMVACRRHSGSSMVHASFWGNWGADTQVIVDGYDQLWWWQRALLRYRCRSKRAGLLATSHKDTGLPDLWRTETSVALARQLVDRLLADANLSWFGSSELERIFAEQRGDLRETMFALYDLFELHGRESDANAPVSCAGLVS